MCKISTQRDDHEISLATSLTTDVGTTDGSLRERWVVNPTIYTIKMQSQLPRHTPPQHRHYITGTASSLVSES